MTLKETVNNVRIKDETSNDFDIEAGLEQEVPLSTLLFNTVLEKIIRDSYESREGHILYRSYQVVEYADNVA